MTYMEKVNWIFGMQIKYNKDEIMLNQEKYIQIEDIESRRSTSNIFSLSKELPLGDQANNNK